MTIQEYNDHPGISASAIKAGRASMMQMRHAMVTPRDSEAASPAMRWGTLAHLAMLQPTEFAATVAVWDSGRKAGAMWQAWAASNEGKQIVTPDELSRLEAMQAACRASADARFFVSKVERVEVPMVWESQHKGVGLCKGRPDCTGSAFVGDYKTARDIEPRTLYGQFERLGYLHQMAWYCDGVETLTGRQVATVLVLAQQSVAPYECGVIEIPVKMLVSTLGADGLHDDDTCLSIARHYRACEAMDSFPGRYVGVTEYERPQWAVGGDFDPNESEE